MIESSMDSVSLIFIGGKAPEKIPFDKSIFSSVIAADSGYDLALSYNFPVDRVVGDFDSTECKNELLRMGYIPANEDKDESDFELALIETKDSSYVLVGGGEGRIDHLISIVTVMEKRGYPIMWLTGEEVIVPFSGEFSFSVEIGTRISIFSLFHEVTLSSKGLKWELNNSVIGHKFMSLSNRTAEEEVSLVSSGISMLTLPLDNAPSICRSLGLS